MTIDTFTETTNQGWFGRIGNSIKGILFGLVLFIASFPVLFMNEGCAAKRYADLKNGKKNVKQNVDNKKIDSSLQGALVHMNGEATTKEKLQDKAFGVQLNAIALSRKVEMYQWVETKSTKSRKKLGGGKSRETTYSYKKEWKTNLIKSQNFKKENGHKNPKNFPLKSKTWHAKNVLFGAFKLNKQQIACIDNYKGYEVTKKIALRKIKKPVHKQVHGYYFGDDTNNPQIGDIRVSFTYVHPKQDVTVIAQQSKNSFCPWQSKHGFIDELRMGTLTADAVFAKAVAENKIRTWIIRACGFLTMLFGLYLIMAPLAVVADVVPFFGSFLEIGIGLISFLVALFCSLITISIAWIVYRPVLGVSLLFIAGVVGIVIIKNRKRKTV